MTPAQKDAEDWMESYNKALHRALLAYFEAHQYDEVLDPKKVERLRREYNELKASKHLWQKRADAGVFWERFWKEAKKLPLQPFEHPWHKL